MNVIKLTTTRGATIYVNVDAIQHFELTQMEGRPATCVSLSSSQTYYARETPEEITEMLNG